LLNKRKEARANKNFTEADKIRDELKEMGIEIEDTTDGAIWRSQN
jgi:cysteinyl-tRNA synthetase|tara:strand:- start:539 stop:673 length:135 start_codon:yes stop_codon:yes gene_type:complete